MEAVSPLQKYVAMTVQYAQERGILPKPNPNGYKVRQTLDSLRNRPYKPQTRNVMAWLRGPQVQEVH